MTSGWYARCIGSRVGCFGLNSSISTFVSLLVLDGMVALLTANHHGTREQNTCLVEKSQWWFVGKTEIMPYLCDIYGQREIAGH